MSRQGLIRIIALLGLILLPGCSRLYDGDYTFITKHEESTELIDSKEQYYEVHTFAGMKNAVRSLISAAAKSGTIRISSDYSGSVEDDISRACLDATRDYPLGAYAVDFISHTVDRILGYHEINLRISYRLPEEEIERVRQANTPADLNTILENSIIIGRQHLAVQISSLAVSEHSILTCIDTYYRKHPDLLASRPTLSVSFYPAEDAVTKIADISISYQESREAAADRLTALDQAADAAEMECSGYPDEIKALLCFRRVTQNMESTGSGRTAYDALIMKSAGSEGCAMAYQLLCNRCGIDCQVIEGRVDGNDRFWNILRLDSEYYHVDCYACIASPINDGFLLSDADMIPKYWWEVEKYPVCSGTLRYQQVLEAYLVSQQFSADHEAGDAEQTASHP